MRLSELTGQNVGAYADIEITGLSADSRAVRPGYLFAALPGTVEDGARYIPQALASGAAAVLLQARAELPKLDVPVIADPEPRRRLALLAATFYGLQPETIAAVTGTNGKSSVADFLRQFWQSRGLASASLGTLGVVSEKVSLKLEHTTPDPVMLHAALRELAEAGVSHLALEASSHGLDQARLDGLRLQAAAFTNLTRDHLDYHASAEDYFKAKCRLFEVVLPANGTAVVPAAGEEGLRLQVLCRQRGQHVLTFGEGAGDIRIDGREVSPAGQDLRLTVCGEGFDLALPLVGDFQARNILCAIGLAIATGMRPADAVAAAGSVQGVRGRLELAIELANGARVYVDYSHTPDALSNALAALRPYTAGRLGVVFGAGGDRDAGKREPMGRACAEGADFAIVTDDNPRGEVPAAIRQAVLRGCPGAKEIGDRAEAIRAGVRRLRTGDVLLVAGKGHEQGQQIGAQLRPFDDVSEARRAAAETEGDGHD